MQTLLLVIVVMSCAALVMAMYRLQEQRRSQQLERKALAMTPTGDEDLTGHWHARPETDNGYVSWGVQLEQHGMMVTGSMQCKFAFAHPLAICGILEDRSLIATWSRPDKYCMGSGIIHLTLSSDGATLTGTTKWYNAENPAGIVDSWCWDRSHTDAPAETRQNNAVNRSGEVGPI